MRSLILGGHGMLGRAVEAEAQHRSWQVLALPRSRADITRVEQVVRWVRHFEADVVFNCAAFTRVDDCEEQKDQAFAINGGAVRNIVQASREASIPLVHISTDYVFDGGAKSPYEEDAPTSPLSVYGRSKFLGELEALSYPEALNVRTSWLFGPCGTNFVRTILRLLDSRQEPLKVVDDQIGCPTYTVFLARALLDLVEAGARGTVHYRNRDPVSWYGLAREMVAMVDPERPVLPVSTDEFPRPAKRPPYSVLSVARFESLLDRPVEEWRSGLKEFLTGLRREGTDGR